MCRYVAFAILAVVILGSTPALADDPVDPPWENRGLIGTEVHTVRYLFSDLFVGGADGLHILQLDDLTWRELVRDGAAGWPLTAVGRAPGFPDHVITGRLDDLDFGALALTYLADGATVPRLEQQPGPFTQVAHTGYFADFRVWACAPGAAQAGVVLRSGSGGEVWQELSGHGLVQPHAFSSSITVVDDDIVPLTLLCGDGGVRVTVDNGETWSPADTGLPTTVVRDVLVAEICIAGIPDKADFTCEWYFAATDAGLYFREELDVPWTQLLADPCRKVVFSVDLHTRRTFVLTADGRLLVNEDPWESTWMWEDWSVDLGPVEITDIDVRGLRLAVGTTAGGVFEKILPDPMSDVPPGAPALSLAVAPNPFNPATTVSFDAPHSGPARLTIHDLRGRLVTTLLDKEIPAGPVSLRWQPRHLASGVYVARLRLNDTVAMRRVALIR